MQFPKLQINKIVRSLMIIMSALLLTGSLIYLFLLWRHPPVTKKSFNVYTYQHKGDLTYQVKLKPNSVFLEEDIKSNDPKQIYFFKIIDMIDLNFSYNFQADQDAVINVAYELLATIDAPKMWSKDFVLVPLEQISKKGRNASFNIKYSLDLANYVNTLKSINEELGVSAIDPKLIIKGNVYIDAVTNHGVVNDSVPLTLSIPLTTGTIKIGGKPSFHEDSALQKTVTAVDQVAKRDRMLYTLIFAAVSAIMLLFFWLMTENKVLVNSEHLSKKIDSVKNKYGNIMVNVNSVDLNEMNRVDLASVNDIMEIADELGKPVVCQVSEENLPQVMFVFDGATVY